MKNFLPLLQAQKDFTSMPELAEPDALATHLAKAIALSRKKKGWISARDLQLGYDSKSRPTADRVRSWFRELEAWIECPSHLEQFSPFEVLEIHPDGWVSLDLVNEFVPICELRV